MNKQKKQSTFNQWCQAAKTKLIGKHFARFIPTTKNIQPSEKNLKQDLGRSDLQDGYDLNAIEEQITAYENQIEAKKQTRTYAVLQTVWKLFPRRALVHALYLCCLIIVPFFLFGLFNVYSYYNSDEIDSQIAIIKNINTADNTVIFDASGNKLAEKHTRFHKFTTLEDLPDSIVDAVLSIEDRRFFAHNGIDMRSIARASWEVLTSGRPKQGASTITQQLVRNYLLSKEKTIIRKIHEIVLAIKLETVLSKETILELYLNNLFLGNGAYGVGAAAEKIFGKEVKDLTVAESALIAGLFQAPSRINPFKRSKLATSRMRQVIKAMVRNGKLTLAQAKIEINRKMRLTDPSATSLSHNSYIIDYIESSAKELLNVPSVKNQGFRIHTSVDLDINLEAHKAVSAMETVFEKIESENNLLALNNRIEASAIVLDVKTGEIVAMIGGRDYVTSNFNRAVQAQRAPGSTFKPIIYAKALENGYKWSDVFYVSPISMSGNYRPKSLASDYLTETTMLRSLYRSMNATTLEIGEKLGLPQILREAKRFGIDSDIKMEYGSLLGQSEVNLLDMIRVYSVFANNGQKIEPVVIRKIENRDGEMLYEAPTLDKRQQRVLSPQINYLMVDGLKKVLSHGTAARLLSLSKYAGGKTGTTNGSTDNWFSGFTKDYLAVVWVGPDKPVELSHGNLQGSTLALPIWKKIAEYTISTRGFKEFTPPKGVTAMHVHPRFGHIQDDGGIEMWFINDSLPKKRTSSLNELDKSGGSIRGFGAH